MKQYLDVLRDIRENGEQSTDRTGVGTLRVVGRQMRFGFMNGFPIITTKNIFFRGIVVELLWFIAGGRNVRDLAIQNVNFWNGNALDWFARKKATEAFGMSYGQFAALKTRINTGEANDEEIGKFKKMMKWFINLIKTDPEFAKEHGDLGPIYGDKWRRWKKRNGEGHVDQLGDAMELMRSNPDSRRIIINAWDPEDVPNVALPWCHSQFQFLVINGRLHIHLNQRSCDMFLGVPFNISSYALLNCMIAHVLGLELGEFVHELVDAHIYRNHVEAVDEQLSREPQPLPKLVLNPELTLERHPHKRPIEILEMFRPSDIGLEGYISLGDIKAPMAV